MAPPQQSAWIDTDILLCLCLNDDPSQNKRIDALIEAHGRTPASLLVTMWSWQKPSGPTLAAAGDLPTAQARAHVVHAHHVDVAARPPRRDKLSDAPPRPPVIKGFERS